MYSISLPLPTFYFRIAEIKNHYQITLPVPQRSTNIGFTEQGYVKKKTQSHTTPVNRRTFLHLPALYDCKCKLASDTRSSTKPVRHRPPCGTNGTHLPPHLQSRHIFYLLYIDVMSAVLPSRTACHLIRISLLSAKPLFQH